MPENLDKVSIYSKDANQPALGVNHEASSGTSPAVVIEEGNSSSTALVIRGAGNLIDAGDLTTASKFTVDNTGNATLQRSLTINRHIHGGGSAPSVVASAGAGSSPPSPVAITGSTDMAGTITWGTGTSPNTQAQLTVTFAAAWTIPGGGGPHVVVTPINSATQALGLYVSGISPTGFNVNVASAPAGSQSNSTYQFCYVVVG